jgi:hypothetical protein
VLGRALRSIYRRLPTFNIIRTLGVLAAEHFELCPRFLICDVLSKPEASLGLLTQVFHMVHGVFPFLTGGSARDPSFGGSKRLSRPPDA